MKQKRQNKIIELISNQEITTQEEPVSYTHLRAHET